MLTSVVGAPSPIGGAVPHSVMREDVYEGMKIPKGATIMMNVGVGLDPHAKFPGTDDDLDLESEPQHSCQFSRLRPFTL